jgi:D-glycero-alpha-D-manno-heptose-7-phosphate kinase
VIISKTPYRLSFFGGGTDYPEWYEKNGGLVIASAFQKYCWISIRELPPFFNHKSRFVYSITEEVSSNEKIIHPGIKSCFDFLNFKDGVEMHYDGDLPSMSGIGSSSSFTVGLLNAIYAFQSKMKSKRLLAEDAIHVERKIEKQNIGIQDQIMASYGGLQIISMQKGQPFRVDPLIISKDYERELSSHVMLGFTGKSRQATEVASKKVSNINAGKVDNQLNEIMSIAQSGLNMLSSNNEIEKIGKLIHQTWLIKKTLTESLSNNSIDSFYDTAIRNGAWGGRLLGAGEGGFFMLIAPPEHHRKIKEALPQVKVWVPYSIDYEGTKIVLCERV